VRRWQCYFFAIVSFLRVVYCADVRSRGDTAYCNIQYLYIVFLIISVSPFISFLASIDVIANTTAVFGNFEFAEKRTNEEEGGRGSSPAQGASNSTVRTSNHVPLVKAAMVGIP